MKVREAMDTAISSCSPDTSVEELARRFAEEGVDYALVLDEEGRLLGIVTESDLVDRERKLHLPTAIAVFDMVIPLGEKRFEEELARLRARTAADLMTREVVTIMADAEIEEAAELMAERGLHHLPVVEGETVVGVLTPHALVKALARRR